MPEQYTETAFEIAIEKHLLTEGGYHKRTTDTFNPELCLDTEVFLKFIQETQPKEWEYLHNLRGAKAAETLLDDLCRALDSEHEGCLKVLRHGFKCFGKTFRAAYFAPASGMNPETQRLYDANILTVTRQVRYAKQHANTLDMVLSLNGIPIITAELKNPMTGQTLRNAIHQYEHDRNPKDLIFQFGKRTLVHFAVDSDMVYMTTRLAGPDTVFLPFNKGDGTGAGNPENPSVHKTAYLWEEIWQKDSIMEIIAKYIHLEASEKQVGGKKVKKKTMIFPRYHQLDVVRKLVRDAQAQGVGKNYLIQHSAGSGKSNSIAWLAHQLSSLHDDEDNKVFDSVVVVTDRRVLDQQLQDTIYQFEHKAGVVEKIDKDSKQLAKALQSTVPIIITTLQKFPYVTEHIGTLKTKRYAVIIDEAHSSQGGETATELKSTLAGESLITQAQQKAEEEGLVDYEEEILRTMAARGRQENISFFAFTATPKYKTLEVFGQKNEAGKPEAFHLYSMRQAIEEKFILDVLEHYTTYQTYFKLIKSIEDDPKVDKKKASKALARFVSLHPYNVSQKTEVIVEHFRTFTRHKIDRKAKAMVVTASRLHAVRYKQAIDKYLKDHGYDDIRTLVAFSGTVDDPDNPDVKYTEVEMNGGIREDELREQFDTDKYHILIVAEKFQTGFDQPLLHTMYVDKKLSGVHAVQTLSRLNRKHPGKDDTFVLDFVNGVEDIQAAFQPYYERTMTGDQADYRQLYELQAKLDTYQVFSEAEVEEFCRVFFRPKEKLTEHDHGKMNAIIDPAVKRFNQLDEDEKHEFRDAAGAYRRLYSFLAQIIPFQDSDLEKLYTFLRFLLTKLPTRESGPQYDFSDDVDMRYYRLDKIHEGSIALEPSSGGEVHGPTAVGTGKVHEDEAPLSDLIHALNERFGTDFAESDRLLWESITNDATQDPELQEAARANTLENFSYVARQKIDNLVINRMGKNSKMVAEYFDNKDFQRMVQRAVCQAIYYESLRHDHMAGFMTDAF
jgi:type I restriction enzyme R subunit